jgi:serine/threonine protein kinase
MFIAFGKYEILSKIGSGTFGSIYKGINTRTKEEVAIKVEKIDYDLKLLKNETKIYYYLRGIKGIPSVKWYGKDENNYYMVIDLLGDSLQTLMDKEKKIKLSTCLKIGIQIIELFYFLHDRGFVHRDVKPDNFLFGFGENKKNIYLIDFGLCIFVADEDLDKVSKNLIGSLKYASINAHDYKSLRRKDDLESLGYMLLYFYLGSLPWENKKFLDKKEANDEIKRMKTDFLQNQNLPEAFKFYFRYLENNVNIDYSIIKKTFETCIKNGSL